MRSEMGRSWGDLEFFPQGHLEFVPQGHLEFVPQSSGGGEGGERRKGKKAWDGEQILFSTHLPHW